MEPKTLPKGETPGKSGQTQTPGVVKSLNPRSSGGFLVKNSILVFIVFILVGVGSGFVIAKVKSSGGSSPLSTTGDSEVEEGAVIGSDDTETFSDMAEGEMVEGGIDDEGTHHLERPGGDSQNVYLTSSVVDLSSFEGKKVKVWGKTFAGEKAGWLMDVGRVEVLE